MARSVIAIPEPKLEKAGDLWRLSATIAGKNVFFESRIPLSPRPEVLVCSFLMPAMAFHADLEVEGGLDEVFLENLDFVRRRVKEWWPELGGGEVRASKRASAAPGPDVGCFYTGGIDSSYVLQQLHPKLRYAVFVEGFDIGLRDEARLRLARETLGATAAACGVELVSVRTNLRQNLLFQQVRWGKNHMGALSAVGHALGSHVHTMFAAASDVPPPWGSAPDLDAAWSSGSLKIENFSAELSRLQRVDSVAKWEKLRGRLRVCLERDTPHLNCGNCEKCVRTRMQLFVAGSPDGLGSFREGPTLRSAMSDLAEAHDEVAGQWREVAERLQDRRLLRHLERALAGRRPAIWRRALREFKKLGERAAREAMPHRTAAVRASQ